MDIKPPESTLLKPTSLIDEHALFYELWMHQSMSILKNNLSERLDESIRSDDELLLEIVLLHKLMLTFVDDDPDQALRLAQKAVGAMLQRKLMLLMAAICAEQRNHFFSFYKLPGIDRRVWEIHIAGAMAAAHVLLTLCHRPEARVFLPTIGEDVLNGIDLFWVEAEKLIAVSIKSVPLNQRMPCVLAWYISSRPQRDESQRISDEYFIWQGAQTCRMAFGRSCAPVLVHVPKPGGQSISLSHKWGQIGWPDQLLQTLASSRTPGKPTAH